MSEKLNTAWSLYDSYQAQLTSVWSQYVLLNCIIQWFLIIFCTVFAILGK